MKLKYVHSVRVYVVKSRAIALGIKNYKNVQKVYNHSTAKIAYFHHISKFNNGQEIELLRILFIL